MEMNAAAVSRCHSLPKELTRLLIVNVMGATFLDPPKKTRAISRSFQTHRNWKMARAANDGTERGKRMWKKAVR